MIHQYKNVVTDIRDADVGDILLTRMHSKHPGPREVHGRWYTGVGAPRSNRDGSL
jgi:hypothetical protein